MKSIIRSKDIEVNKPIKDYIESKLEKVDKFFRNPNEITANIVLKLRGHEQIIEVTIPTKNLLIRNEESQSDLYAAIDLVMDKIERQIRKNKEKIGRIDKDKFLNYEIENGNEEENQKITKRKKIDTKPMSEEEAILQMEMLGHDFYIFKDGFDGKIKVLYLRKDKDYGIIEVE
ncbi:MAG: ribosome-associated translation inhibitor RaiA [Tenericutes bacterium]|nr:ribosome-associated translation inhibitor RaiA [Mycoplasmatota bacterium]